MINAVLSYRFFEKEADREKSFLTELMDFLNAVEVECTFVDVEYVKKDNFSIATINMTLAPKHLLLLDGTLSLLRNSFGTGITEWANKYADVIYYGYIDFVPEVKASNLSPETAAHLITYQNKKMTDLSHAHYEGVAMMVAQQNKLRNTCIDAVNTCQQLLDKFEILKLPNEVDKIKRAIGALGIAISDEETPKLNPLLH